MTLGDAPAPMPTLTHTLNSMICTLLELASLRLTNCGTAYRHHGYGYQLYRAVYIASWRYNYRQSASPPCPRSPHAEVK